MNRPLAYELLLLVPAGSPRRRSLSASTSQPFERSVAPGFERRRSRQEDGRLHVGLQNPGLWTPFSNQPLKPQTFFGKDGPPALAANQVEARP